MAKIMQMALQDEEFHQQVVEFIKSTIHTDIDEMDTNDLLNMLKKTSVSYSRPVDPVKEPEESDQHEKNLTRAVQLHQCNTRTCL